MKDLVFHSNVCKILALVEFMANYEAEIIAQKLVQIGLVLRSISLGWWVYLKHFLV